MDVIYRISAVLSLGYSRIKKYIRRKVSHFVMNIPHMIYRFTHFLTFLKE